MIPTDDDGGAAVVRPGLAPTWTPGQSVYSDELAAEIVEVVGLSARSMTWLCEANPHWPSVATIWNWKAQKPEFRNAFNEARSRLAHELAFQCIEIADDGSGDAKTVERRDGSSFTVLDQEFVARSKLRVEARRWLAGKLDPINFGDRLDVNARVGPILSQEDALDQLR